MSGKLVKEDHISLVTIRIEIADDYEHLTHLHYTAPHLQNKEPSSSVEGLTEANLPCSFSGQISEELVHKTWGRRKLDKIEIITGFCEEMSDDESGPNTEGESESKTVIKEAQEEVSPDNSSTNENNVKEEEIKSTPKNTKDHYGARPRLSAVAVSGVDNKFCPIVTSVSPVIFDEEPPTPPSRPGSARLRPKSHSPKQPLMIPFFSGNQRSDLVEGIIHLFKDSQSTSLAEDVPRSEMICMLAVPATLNTHDLLNFTAPVYPGIKEIRIIRDSTPNQYMVLLKFKTKEHADEFYRNYNGKPFNSLETDITCLLVYVSKFETIKVSEGACLPDRDQVELPKCPVCLERMDESVDGILTTQCNHSFHGYCLSKWGDTSCPVCRYVQTPEVVEDNKCFTCGATESLWICVICGNIGCGRYVETHAYEHFQETQHTFAMQIGTNRVWDYAGDNYVHRLIQNKGDGKPVQLVDASGQVVSEEKLENVALEYTYFFTTQLEQQRNYFEERLTRVELNAQHEIEEGESRSKTTLEECDRLQRRLLETNVEKQVLDRKSSQMGTKITKLTSQLNDELEMNKCLRENQKQWQVKVDVLQAQMKRKDEEMKDLKEQLHDIMFYMEAQQKLASQVSSSQVSAEELQSGLVVVGSPPSSTSSRRHKKKPAR